MCCSFMAVVCPCPLKWYFRGTGRRATMMLGRFEGFDQILVLMFPGLKYTGDSFLSPEQFVRCDLPELPNERTIVAPSGRRSYWSGQKHSSYDEIQLTNMFSPLPVDWFHPWVDTFLSIIQFLRGSIWHMFPERRLLHGALNAFNRIAVKAIYVIIVAKVVWIGQMILTHLAGFPRVNAHRAGHLVQSSE